VSPFLCLRRGRNATFWPESFVSYLDRVNENVGRVSSLTCKPKLRKARAAADLSAFDIPVAMHSEIESENVPPRSPVACKSVRTTLTVCAPAFR